MIPERKVKYGVAIAEIYLGDGSPVPLQGGLVGAMSQAAALGFESVEIQVHNPRTLQASVLREAAARHGLIISAVGTGLEYGLNGLSLTSPDEKIRKATIARFREHIDLGEELGALVFAGLCRGKSPDNTSRPAYLDRLAENLVPVADYARQKNVILGFEPIVFYLTNLLNTTEETLAFLDRPQLVPYRDTLRLLLDTHHMFIEDRDMAAAFRMCAGRIAHVHLSDSNRREPGSGNVDFSIVAEVLREIGYEGSVSLEILPGTNGEQAAARGLAWIKPLFGD